MISQSAEYALRAVVWLAGHPAETLSTGEIARCTAIPAGYLSKVLQVLSRAGLVTSTPGCTGGFSLARPASSISVLEVINAISPLQRIQRCPLGAHGKELCPLHQVVDDAAAHVESALADVTMADVLEGKGRTGVLCESTRRMG